MNTERMDCNSKTQRMECQHCGFSEAIKMPAPLDAILGKMDAFMDKHKDCKPPQAEAVMSEYIKGFDAGYAYVLNEVENYIKSANSHDAMVLVQLLAHLKMEGKPQ